MIIRKVNEKSKMKETEKEKNKSTQKHQNKLFQNLKWISWLFYLYSLEISHSIYDKDIFYRLKVLIHLFFLSDLFFQTKTRDLDEIYTTYQAATLKYFYRFNFIFFAMLKTYIDHSIDFFIKERIRLLHYDEHQALLSERLQKM